MLVAKLVTMRDRGLVELRNAGALESVANKVWILGPRDSISLTAYENPTVAGVGSDPTTPRLGILGFHMPFCLVSAKKSPLLIQR